MLRIFQHPIIMLYFSVPRVDTLQFVCDIDHRTNEIPNHFYGKRKQCEEGGIGETTSIKCFIARPAIDQPINRFSISSLNSFRSNRIKIAINVLDYFERHCLSKWKMCCRRRLLGLKPSVSRHNSQECAIIHV